jgi:hypothetical protein
MLVDDGIEEQRDRGGRHKMFSALQYGAIGLATIMFVVVVRLLQAEQKVITHPYRPD